MLIYQRRGLIETQRTHNQPEILLFIRGFDFLPADFQLQTVVEMKPRLTLMLAFAKKLVLYQPRALTLIERHRPPVCYGRAESPVAIMLRDNLVIFRV